MYCVLLLFKVAIDGDRKISMFTKYFQIEQMDFFQKAVIQLPLPVCIYLSSFFWNKSEGWGIIQENR